MQGSTSTSIACPAKCNRDDCFIHQDRWEPIAGLVIISNYTTCNSCGYKAMQLIVPKEFQVIQD